MRKVLVLAGALFLLVCLAPVFAEWETRSNVVVPFEFTVGDNVYPAGTYTVLTDAQTHAVSLINKDTRSSSNSLTHDILLTSSGTADTTKLIFAFDGRRHVLHQVVIQGDNHIHDVIHGQIVELKGTPPT